MLKSEKRKFLTENLQRAVKELNKLDIMPGYITTKEVALFLGFKDPGTARQFTYGCQKIGARYFIPEVAEKLVEAGF